MEIKPKKPFYKRKRLWIPLILLTPIAVYLIWLVQNPIGNFRRSVNFLLHQVGVEQRTVKIGTRYIHYYEAGQGHDRNVILLHGFGGNAMFTWMRLLPAIGKKYHVIAPDMLASNFIQLNPKTYSVIAEKDMVMSLLDQLKIEKADFVGLSVGGWVSLLIALEHPEKVDRLILVESAGITTDIPELARLTLTDRATARKFMGLLFYKPPPLPGFVLDEMVKSSSRIKAKYEAVFMGFVENSRSALLDNRLQDVHQPTLFIHGREDKVIPLPVAEKMHQMIPQSEMLILEESGHAPVWDQPGLLKKAIMDFLANGSKNPAS